MAEERIIGKAAIAKSLGIHPETLRKWSKIKPLPLHQPVPGSRTVYAYPSELDQWIKDVQESPVPSPRPVASDRSGIVVDIRAPR